MSYGSGDPPPNQPPVDPSTRTFAFFYLPSSVSLVIVAVLWTAELGPPGEGIPWRHLGIGFLATGITILGLLAKLHGDLTSRDSWLFVAINGVALIVTFALLFDSAGIVPSGETTSVDDRRDLIYFSVVTFTTLGYGDFTPQPPARLLAALEAIGGYFYLGIVIAMATLTGRQAADPQEGELAAIVRRAVGEALDGAGLATDVPPAASEPASRPRG